MNKIPAVQTSLICPECGNITSIWRRTGRQKELYHKKKFFCPMCQKELNHIELKNIDFFIASLNFKDNLTEEEKYIKSLVKKRGE